MVRDVKHAVTRFQLLLRAGAAHIVRPSTNCYGSFTQINATSANAITERMASESKDKWGLTH